MVTVLTAATGVAKAILANSTTLFYDQYLNSVHVKIVMVVTLMSG